MYERDYAAEADDMRARRREAEPDDHQHDWIELQDVGSRYVTERCTACSATRARSRDAEDDLTDPEPTDPADWAQQQRDDAALEAAAAERDDDA